MIDNEFWKGKKVFLTGNSGFKGSWLSIWLASMGAKVYGYSKGPSTTPSLYKLANLKYVCTADYEYDILSKEALFASINTSQPGIVIHMAAQPLVAESYKDPVGTFNTNVIGTLNILEAVRQCPSVKVFLNITTDKVYINTEDQMGYVENSPLGGFDPYAASKACSEIVTASYRDSFLASTVAIATARAGNVIGGGDWAENRIVPDCIRALSKGEAPIIRNPNSHRPWQHVLDVLAGYLILCQALWEDPPSYSSGWNFGPEYHGMISVKEIVERIGSLWPSDLGYTLADNFSMHETQGLYLNIEKSRRWLEWSPKWQINVALEKTVEWFQETEVKHNYLGLCQRQIEEYQGSL
jgi:CDP-glucose 4,6-dehydratase